MSQPEINQTLKTPPTHCIITESAMNNLNSNWQQFLKKQTMLIDFKENHNNFFIQLNNLGKETPQQHFILLEMMAWVLLSQNDCDFVVWPLSSSIDNKSPLTLLNVKENALVDIKQQGFIGLSKHSVADLSKARAEKTLCFSHALLSNQNNNTIETHSSLLRKLKNNLSLEQKIFIKRKFDALKELLSFNNKTLPLESCLAYSKSWTAKSLRPHLAININSLYKQKERIPVLIATHWLELGGAEKFAIDLIKALPKDRYAIYVTTDISSFNQWSNAISDQVEAIFHLPSFLTNDTIKVFYEHLIRSRQIRLMHIHHAAQAYESLHHIRRFHPQLKILDSLHILETPPNEGGYVEASAKHFEPFINYHHVISHFLENFLMQRWQVPKNKISVTYLNVDSDYFNPENVKKGQIRNSLNITDNTILIGFIGRFSQQKQPLEFIKTAQLLQQRWQQTNQPNPLVFLMTGSGLLKSKIIKAIELVPDTSILLHPEVEDTRPIYQDCDVLMMPSENEGLALVSYEAMAMQTPIFFTDVGAQSELLQAEFLIENNKPLADKFANAVWPFLINAEKRQLAGIKMREYIREYHHHQQTYSQLFAIYQQLLSEE